MIYSFIFLFFGFGFISQVAAETWYVKKSKTKLQAKAKARSKVLGKLNKGTPVDVLGKSGKFYKVSVGSETGWIFIFKLTKKAPSGSSGDSDLLGALGGQQQIFLAPTPHPGKGTVFCKNLNPATKKHLYTLPSRIDIN